MPTPERVQPYKSESTAAGGSDAEAAPYPVLIKPQSEALDSAGLYLQDLSNYDYAVTVTRSGNDLVFTDVTTGALNLSDASNLLLNYKNAVVAASIGSNITLSGTYTLDGYGLSVGQRVLAKDQTTGANNGIYITSAGAWTRATDMDSSAKALAGMRVTVMNGTVNGGSTWRMSNTSNPTLGVTALTFARLWLDNSNTLNLGSGALTTTGSLTALNGTLSGTLSVTGVTTVANYINRTTGNGNSSWLQQDGTGRVHWYWNTLGSTSPVFTNAAEDAASITMSANNAGLGGYVFFRSASGVGALAGDPITWTTTLSVDNTNITYKGSKIWHAGNDGTGSGLDADLFRGVGIGYSGNFWNTIVGVSAGGVSEIGRYIDFHNTSATVADFDVRLDTGNTSTDLYINYSGKIWHSGNDGTGSGLDADLLDGLDSTAFTLAGSHAALSIYGRSANSVGTAADIAAVAASGSVLRESGSTIGFGTIATAGIANNAVTLAKLATQATHTVLANVTAGTAVPTASTTLALAQYAADTNGTAAAPTFLVEPTGNSGLYWDATNGVVMSVDGANRIKALVGSRTEITGAGGVAGGAAQFTTVGVADMTLFVGTASPEASITGSPGDIFSDTTNGVLYVKKTGVGNTGWVLNSTTAPTTCLVVGNSLEGDTLAVCHYLDPGTGTGIAAALASGGTAKTVFVRRGTYTLAATQALLSVPAGWTLQGEGTGATIIKPRIGDAATTPWVCVNLSGEKARILDIGFSVRDRAATIPAVTLPLGVVSIGAKNTYVKNIYVDIPGAMAGTVEPFAAVAISTTAAYGGQIIEDVTLNMASATLTGDAVNTYPFCAIASGSIAAPGNVATVLADTVAEPVFSRIRILGGQCDEVASPVYYTLGMLSTSLSEFTMIDCDFRGVQSGIIGSWTWNSGSAGTTRGPNIRNLYVLNDAGMAASYVTGGVAMFFAEAGAGAFTVSRVHVEGLTNDGGSTGAFLPGVTISMDCSTARDVRVRQVAATAKASGGADTYCSVSMPFNTGTMDDVEISGVVLTPSGVNNGFLTAGSSTAATVTGLRVRGNVTDDLSISGSGTSKAIVSDNRARTAYSDAGTSTSISNNVVA